MNDIIKRAKDCWSAIVHMPTSETTSVWYPAPASEEEIETFYKAAFNAGIEAAKDTARFYVPFEDRSSFGEELRALEMK